MENLPAWSVAVPKFVFNKCTVTPASGSDAASVIVPVNEFVSWAFTPIHANTRKNKIVDFFMKKCT
jgi:hypothetical protein